MSVKRAAVLAAGLVVVAGLVGGCAQKPGVAATATPVSCGKKAEAAPVFSVDSDGTVLWSCGAGSVVRGESMTISTTEVADVIVLAESPQGSLTGTDAVEALVGMQTVLRVAEEQGVKISDDEAEAWLDEQGYEVNDGTMIVARYSVLGTRASAAVGSPGALTEEQVVAIDAGLNAAVSSLDVVVNPRFGTFDPEQFAVVPPAWTQNQTLPVGL